jgi:hypothetical protein
MALPERLRFSDDVLRRSTKANDASEPPRKDGLGNVAILEEDSLAPDATLRNAIRNARNHDPCKTCHAGTIAPCGE